MSITIRRIHSVLQGRHGNQADRRLPKISRRLSRFYRRIAGANTQGATLEEARTNLKEAVEMVLQANRNLAEES